MRIICESEMELVAGGLEDMPGWDGGGGGDTGWLAGEIVPIQDDRSDMIFVPGIGWRYVNN